MYESHFGLSGPPFQLNPDPDFYFESRGHGQALAYLRFGVQQGEGFIVVTGDAGTGKTTLVRTLLQQLDEREVVAAQLSNTQLDATELLLACLTAFGVRSSGPSKAAAIASIEAFLTGVAASGRRALLVVDEAQNLGRAALEELRMLSNFQLGHHGLLQVFLVGQPQLRARLQSAELEQLRQRILASHHLDALDEAETTAYVLHRLRHVGWTGRPGFDAAALAAVHTCSGGIPRRVNVLCNRLLLATYLGERDSISAALVHETAVELQREVKAPHGTAAPKTVAAASPPREVRSSERIAAATATAPAASVMPLARRSPPAAADAAAVALDAIPAPAPQRMRQGSSALPADAILALADGPLAWDSLRVLAAHWGRRRSLPPLVRVHVGVGETSSRSAAPRVAGSEPSPELVLGVGLGASPRLHAERVLAFGTLLDEAKPAGLIVVGTGSGLLQCVLTAREFGVPVVRLGAGDRRGARAQGCAGAAALIDRCAELLCVDSLAARHVLAAEGFPARSIVRVPSLVNAVVRSMLPQLPEFDERLAQERLHLPQAWCAAASGGFGLISARLQPEDVAPEDALHWVMLARHAHAAMPWLWPATDATAEMLAQPSMRRLLDQTGIAVVRCEERPEQLAMLRKARCVLAGPARELVDEAVALGVPAIVVDLYANGSLTSEGEPVVRVGPSASQLKAALAAIAEPAREDAPAGTADDEAPTSVVEHIARWFEQVHAPGLGATWDEAAA